MLTSQQLQAAVMQSSGSRTSLDAPYERSEITTFNPIFALTTSTLTPSIAYLPNDGSRPASDDATGRDCHARWHDGTRKNLGAFLDDAQRR